MNPWDEGCKVTPLIGGDETMMVIRESLLAAIDQAKAHHGGFGALGHVYFAGWRLTGFATFLIRTMQMHTKSQPWTLPCWDLYSGLCGKVLSLGLFSGFLLGLKQRF